MSTCLLDRELHKSMGFTYFMFSFQSSSMFSPFQGYTNPLIRWGRGEKQEESRKTPRHLCGQCSGCKLASVDLKIWKYSRLKLIFLLLVSKAVETGGVSAANFQALFCSLGDKSQCRACSYGSPFSSAPSVGSQPQQPQR